MPAGAINLGKSGTTVYSFATSKSLSGLGGAVVVANDRSLVEHIVFMTYQGMQFSNPDELFSFGGNFKMNDLNATIILEQLKKSETIFEKRRMLKSWYDRELLDLAKAGKIVIQKVSEESVVTHYAILIPDRKAVAHKLLQKGIEIGFWHTAHLQKIYQKRFGTKTGSLPVSESLAPCITFLPFHTKLEEKDVSFICNEIKKVI
jgi:UDP-4-amino-4,6-dideoxy-L-N-acetyl-beta-L-altrosamine transaminase